jgi:hypothetical protein
LQHIPEDVGRYLENSPLLQKDLVSRQKLSLFLPEEVVSQPKKSPLLQEEHGTFLENSRVLPRFGKYYFAKTELFPIKTFIK